MKLLSLLTCLTCVYPVYAQVTQTELLKELGVSKRIIHFYWSVDDTTFDKTVEIINRKGLVTESKKINGFSTLKYHSFYKYDSLDRPVLTISHQEVLREFKIDSTRIEYNLTGQIYTDFDGPYYYELNQFGNPICKYEPYGIDTFYTWFYYDTVNRLTRKENKTGIHGRTTSKVEFEYDTESRLINKTSTYFTYYSKKPKSRESVYLYTYTYYSNGLLKSILGENIKWLEMDEKSKTSSTYYFYDFY